MKPTEVQIKKFWEWCGFAISGTRYYLPGITLRYIVGQPEIDLNNLFKYAVPKLGLNDRIKIGWSPVAGEMLYTVEIIIWSQIGLNEHLMWTDKDPALALFWAIYKVMEAK